MTCCNEAAEGIVAVVLPWSIESRTRAFAAAARLGGQDPKEVWKAAWAEAQAADFVPEPGAREVQVSAEAGPPLPGRWHQHDYLPANAILRMERGLVRVAPGVTFAELVEWIREADMQPSMPAPFGKLHYPDIIEWLTGERVARADAMLRILMDAMPDGAKRRSWMEFWMADDCPLLVIRNFRYRYFYQADVDWMEIDAKAGVGPPTRQ